MVPVLGTGKTLAIPLSLQTYRGFAKAGALDINSAFRHAYPQGLRRLPLDRIGQVWGISTTRWWQQILEDERGAVSTTGGSAGYTGAGTTTATLSATLGAGTKLLVAAAATDRSGSGTTVSSHAFDGSALTLKSAVTGPSTETLRTGWLLNPTSGSAKNLVATYSSPNTNMGQAYIAVNGCDTTTPTGTSSDVSGTGNSVASWTINPTTNGSLLVGFCAHLVNGITVTQGSGVAI